jgi:hypothetical protein
MMRGVDRRLAAHIPMRLADIDTDYETDTDTDTGSDCTALTHAVRQRSDTGQTEVRGRGQARQHLCTPRRR